MSPVPKSSKIHKTVRAELLGSPHMGASPPPLPEREAERLIALARYDILNTPPEDAFDNITKLAAEVLNVPIAAINFVSEGQQFSKSCVGFAAGTLMPRGEAPCSWTVLESDLLVIENVSADARFAGGLLPTLQPPLRLYAGVPLMTADGFAIGSLCVMDTEPHPLDERERRVLRRLALMVMDELELRAARHRLENEAQARGQMLLSMRQAAQHAETLAAVSALAELDLELPELIRRAAELLAQMVPLDWVGLHVPNSSGPGGQSAWHSPQAGGDFLAMLAAPATNRSQTTSMVHQSGRAHFVDNTEELPLGGRDREFVRVGVRSVAWLPLTVYGGEPQLLVFARLHEARPWRRRERTLLEATAATISRALERRQLLRHAERLAYSDPLTGLGNLRAFHRDLEARLQAGQPFGLAMLDLDRFREVNDAQGPARGDTLLRLFGQALVAEWRAHDGVYRLGGDELAVLIEDTAAWSTIQLLEDWVLEHVDVAVSVARQAGFNGIGASTGLARFPDDALDARSLVERADGRMYAVKRARKLRLSPLSAPPPSAILVSELSLDPQQHEASYGGQAVRLRPKESELLALLARDPERVFSRQELSGRLWEGETPPSGNVLEVHLTNLRKKLAGLAPHIKIRAVRGQGYNLTVDKTALASD